MLTNTLTHIPSYLLLQAVYHYVEILMGMGMKVSWDKIYLYVAQVLHLHDFWSEWVNWKDSMPARGWVARIGLFE